MREGVGYKVQSGSLASCNPARAREGERVRARERKWEKERKWDGGRVMP